MVMTIEYLFSAPKEDIPAGLDELSLPFKITPSEQHPFLALRDYFEAIRRFILIDQEKPLVRILKERFSNEIDFNSIEKILIRSEKHGVLYHLASVEILADDKRTRLAVSTAISEKSRAWLTHEYKTLKFLNRSRKLPYLPEVYFKREVACPPGKKKKETLSMFLGQWFEGYHEWHISVDQKDSRQKICIWDLKEGHRYASSEEAFEIFKQISKILTLYYDTIDFNQIYPWHHAAGDFIVKSGDRGIDVKLTTAREYQSIMDYFLKDAVNPMIALIYFFLNLSVKVRLDKLDGVEKMVWAGDFSVRAAVEGFFEALVEMERAGTYHLGKAEDLFALLKTFGREEIERLFQPLLDLYRKGDPEDYQTLRPNLESHVSQLYLVLQGVHLAGFPWGY